MNKKVIHSVFEAVAKKHALKTAIKSESFQISFEALNQYANRLAHLLQSVSGNTGRIVNVVASPSVELVAALLAVFKSGNIYLPVDLGSSEKRLQQIFSTTFDGIVIVAKNQKEQFFSYCSKNIVSFEHLFIIGEDGWITLYGSDLRQIDFVEKSDWLLNPELSVEGSDSNYIFYTSGSTGEAKAIEGQHISLSHFIHWEVKEFELDDSFRVSHLTQMTFDASLREIFVALITGSVLLIPSEDTKANPAKLLQWLQEEQVSILHCVPSLFRLLVKEMQLQDKAKFDLSHLKYLLMAGEALYSKDIINWRKAAGEKTQLVNLYGATETTLIKTFFRVGEIDLAGPTAIPVGRPISNTTVAIIKDGNICTPGEIGEIYIKTPFATKGYYKNDELTKKVFVKNPLSDDSSDIVYQTGDLGRYLSDGNIEVLGRLDSQVKINGIRVELSEIEQAILTLDAITGAVVKTSRDENNVTTLIAYYTGELRDPDQFRTALTKVLNQQMLPSYYIHMDEFPLNMNGKIDRKALPVPEDIMMSGAAIEAPVGDLEVTLSEYWKEIFSLKQVSRNISFFAIGGHSLRAIQLAAKIQRELGVSIKIADIFQHKTISELAIFIQSCQLSEDQLIVQSEVADSYPVSFAQRRLWVLSQIEEASSAYHVPVAYVFDGNLQQDSLLEAFQQLVGRHEILRTVFKENADGEIRQFIQDDQAHQYNIINFDLSEYELTDSEVAMLVKKEFSKPFDLASGPLIRAALIKTKDQKWVFTCVMHHIICDGWSVEIMLNDLLKFYLQSDLKAALPLKPLPIQYKDYAVWQQKLNGEGLKQHKDYWLQQLSGQLPVIELPFDKARPSLKTYNGDLFIQKLDRDVVKNFKNLLENEQSTLFMGLLAVMNTLFYRYSNQTDIIIGSPTAGRDKAELNDQIGFYLNMLALRTQFSGSDNFIDLLRKIKLVTMQAFEHQVYPFDELVDELNLQRDMSRNALFDVMLILQKTSDTSPDEFKKDLKFDISSFDVKEISGSKYDLSFHFSETDDELFFSVEYNTDLFDSSTIARLATYFNQLLERVVNQSSDAISTLEILSIDDRSQLSLLSGATVSYAVGETVVSLFEAQVLRTPDATALVFEERELSYMELNQLSNQLGQYLQERYGIQADDVVGIRLDRSEWLVIGMLGILKSGGAYLPIDPHYPSDRISYLMENSNCKGVLDEDVLSSFLQVRDTYGSGNAGKISPESLCYVIYTSGSTGKPKGCMLEHRNVVNFFMGMEGVFGREPGTLLSLTNFTFDISVLELLWTLTLGYQVILERDVLSLASPEAASLKPLDFSLFYFGNAEPGNEQDKYKLVLDGARFADENGYKAVWTPERHFHEFGGLFPNPSVLGGALSTITKNVSIRAGSVVMPLHNPLRVAEEWSVIDNLSGGRVGIACASGWNANDFVFSPESFGNRQEVMYQGIETLQKLWRGETIQAEDGNGILKDIKVFPRPLSPELPVWITSANSIETFISAGRLGLNVLTHLLGETVEGLGVKIMAYRNAYAESGHDLSKSKVALMLHTYIGDDEDTVSKITRQPFINYLKTSIGLVRNLAADLGMDMNSKEFTAQDMEALLEHSYKRYVSSASLIGTKESTTDMLHKLSRIGVDEIACLIDFGVAYEPAMKSLEYLTEIKQSYEKKCEQQASRKAEAKSYEGITHLQVTPSMATLLETFISKQGTLKNILIGGERLPLSLVRKLYEQLPDVSIYNMYGPTETTIWSSCSKVEREPDKITIGKPIANTRIYILDKNQQLLPLGATGELYISGAGVARGYINNPALSSERFLSDPYLPGERMYRTGDYGKWLPDGRLEYWGRKDDQVKIRGHRIELGEIESALQENVQVQEASVTVMMNGEGEYELTAYLRSDSGLNVVGLRTDLLRRLPSYMIPGYFVQVDQFPLTPNGKVDKAKLALVERIGRISEDSYVAPQNEIERQIAGIWKDLLENDNIGVKDNFFDIGGNSIKIVKMVSQVNQMFDKRLSVAMAFKFTTISALAEYFTSGDDQDEMVASEKELDISIDVMDETFKLLNSIDHE